MLYNLSKLPASIRSEIEANPRLVRFFSAFPDKMVVKDGNAKTIKGNKSGYITGIMYLISGNQSGVNVCPMAQIAQCDLPCLVTAGRGAMHGVFYSRLRKTLFWLQYNDKACELIRRDIKRLANYAKKNGYKLAIRLNGTSDIRFENYNIIQQFPDIIFYDYTKLSNRKNIPANYDLTFSYSGVDNFAPYISQALSNGMRIAVVFRDKETVKALIDNGVKFLGRDIIDGDSSDLRFLEPKNCIVALYAKGRARRDGSRFVVDSDDNALYYGHAIAA